MLFCTAIADNVWQKKWGDKRFHAKKGEFCAEYGGKQTSLLHVKSVSLELSQDKICKRGPTGRTALKKPRVQWGFFPQTAIQGHICTERSTGEGRWRSNPRKIRTFAGREPFQGRPAICANVGLLSPTPAMVQQGACAPEEWAWSTRRMVLFGDSITQYAFSPEGGFGTRLADRYVSSFRQ